MTQAYNLSQLANNLNSSGQVDATDGLVNAVPVANGGTGASSSAAARTNLDVPSRAGSDATGTWGINITGNAATVTSVTTNANLTGPITSTGNATAIASKTGTGSTFVMQTSPTLTTPNIDSAQFATVIGTAPLYASRAWVNFNGTGVVAIRASGNVSSITDNGTGLYTVNFTTAMQDVNYCALASYNYDNSGTGGNNDGQAAPYDFTTTTVNILTTQGAGGLIDTSIVVVSIFR